MAEKEKYSFSKLSTFHTCPYGYYLKYVLKQSGIGNAFSSYGSFVHSLMERYTKGECEIWDLADLYEWEFDTAVPESFPWNKYVVLHDSYYQQGLEFLKSFQGYDKYTILGVEQQFFLGIGDWTFEGIIDLIYKDDKGNLVIRDYKSKASFKNPKEQKEYARQLYLYSLYVKKQYGEYPKRLEFLMFRKNKLITIDFDEKDLKEAVQWAEQTVDDIRNAFDFPPKCEEFFANNLCNHREYCERRGEAPDVWDVSL